MKKQTKWVIGGVVVVLVAVSAILFSNTGLMKGSMQGLKLKSSAPAINKVVSSKAEAVLFKKLCSDNGGVWNTISLACTFKGVKYASRGAMKVAMGGGSSAPAVNNSDPMYVNANWTCHDGSSSAQGGGSSCKSRSMWLSYATTACTGKRNAATGKEGINEFGVSNPCSQQQAAPAEQAGAPVSAAPSELSSNGNVVNEAAPAQNNNAAAQQGQNNDAEVAAFKALCVNNAGDWNTISITCLYQGTKYCLNGNLTCVSHQKDMEEKILLGQQQAAAPVAGQDDAAAPPAMSANPGNNDVPPASSAGSVVASPDAAPAANQPQNAAAVNVQALPALPGIIPVIMASLDSPAGSRSAGNNQILARFNVSARSNQNVAGVNSIRLEKFDINFQKYGVNLGENVYLYPAENDQNPSSRITGQWISAKTVRFTLTDNVDFTSMGFNEVTLERSQSFVLRGDIVATAQGGSMVTMLSNIGTPVNSLGDGDNPGDIQWNDGTTTFYWTAADHSYVEFNSSALTFASASGVLNSPGQR